MSYNMKKFRKDMKKKHLITTGSLLFLVTIFILGLIVSSLVSYNDGFNEGYTQSFNDQQSMIEWNEFKAYPMEVKTEAFLTVLMFSIADNLRFFWTVVIIFFILLAMRI